MTAPCPVCGKPVLSGASAAPPAATATATAPFCSKRCADIDLGRWLTGRYVVPGRDGEADAEQEHTN